MKPINLKEKHSLFQKQWHPHQIAIVDDMQVILAKVQGEFVWHAHENEDELFQVLKGTLYMKFRDRTEVVKLLLYLKELNIVRQPKMVRKFICYFLKN